ncbi:MAG: hypothetical protein ABL886_05350 [Rhodoglobus sp.]
MNVVFGLVGTLGTIASLLAWSWEVALAIGGGLILCAYFSALLVRARERSHGFELVEDGGIRGQGHSELFRRSRQSLLLMHVDDDAPDAALLGLYRSLLERGVQIRRLVFLRPDVQDWRWMVEFGTHANLRQRVILPEEASLTRFSFAVVDELMVALSVPGIGAIDTPAYAPRFVLRHLLVLRDRHVGRVFARVHGELWAQGHDLPDPAALLDPASLVASCRQDRDR